MNLDRRRILAGASAATLLDLPFPSVAKALEGCDLRTCESATPTPTRAQTPKTPNFDTRGAKFVAGLRPHRRNAYRLDVEASPPAGKIVVHNYGHAGAGITMCWGCANEVWSLLVQHAPLDAEKTIAILGAGVMGLTAAALILERNAKVKITIYSDKFHPNTTSNKAGGQWYPSSVAYEGKEQQFSEILNFAFRKRLSNIGRGYDVSRRENFTLHESPEFNLVSRDLIPCPRVYSQMPFPGMRGLCGYSYQTLLVEPPIFLPKLMGALRASRRVVFHTKKIDRNANSIATLPERVVVNCTGLGARDFVDDTEPMKGVRGQLILLRAQRGLNYLMSGRETDCRPGTDFDVLQYVFPRQDCVVVGGTYEEDNESEIPDQAFCKMLAAHAQKLFEGDPPC
jgi:D-amino-acid oxidase